MVAEANKKVTMKEKAHKTTKKVVVVDDSEDDSDMEISSDSEIEVSSDSEIDVSDDSEIEVTEDDEIPIPDDSKAKWKPYPVEKFSHYMISDVGTVMDSKGSRLKFYFKSGYLSCYTSSIDGKEFKNYKIHRMVAEAFMTKGKTTEKSEVNHIDGNKFNNRVSNLEWISPKENKKHAGKSGLTGKTCRPVHKLDTKGKIIKTYPSCRSAEIDHGLCKGSVTAVCKGDRKRAGGFHWKYVNDNTNRELKKVDLTGCKKIVGWENYIISPKGFIFSFRTLSELKKTNNHGSGYSVQVAKPKGDGEKGQNKKSFQINKIVGEYFLKKPKGDYNSIRFIRKPKNSDDAAAFNVSNLKWVIDKSAMDYPAKSLYKVPVLTDEEIKKIDKLVAKKNESREKRLSLVKKPVESPNKSVKPDAEKKKPKSTNGSKTNNKLKVKSGTKTNNKKKSTTTTTTKTSKKKSYDSDYENYEDYEDYEDYYEESEESKEEIRKKNKLKYGDKYVEI